MPQYVLINRRSGLFTETAKVASRASVATTLNMLTNASGQVRALLDNLRAAGDRGPWVSRSACP